MKYQVLDNGRPADWRIFLPTGKQSEEFKKSWPIQVFDTVEDAMQYAQKWCGSYILPFEIQTNKKIDYSGYGDTIEIREID